MSAYTNKTKKTSPMGSRSLVRHVFSLLCFFSLVATTSSLHAEPQLTPIDQRAVAPDFELMDLKGQAIKLSQFKGRVVVVNFWATWCGPCKQEIPHLSRILETYKDQGLEVLTISTDSPQTQSQVGRLARRWKTHTLLDPEGQVVSQLNPRGIAPFTLIVDRSGRIAFDHDGYHSGDEVKMETAIKAVLSEGKKK
jgi:peroxiredoxin